MPIGVYLALCAKLGIPPDYPIEERFKLDFEVLRRAVDSTLGELLDHLEVGEGMRLSWVDQASNRQARTAVAHLLQSHYDLIAQVRLDQAKEDEGEEGPQ